MARSRRAAMKKSGNGSAIVVRPGQGYLAVVEARETADGSTKALLTACHEKFERERKLASTVEAAVVNLIGAGRMLV